jgi:protein phosphatase PTC2/3
MVQVFTNKEIAEFRGPGVRHQYDQDSPDDYELDSDQRARGGFGRNGRIILLGDGTEVLTDSDDTDMFDHTEEDKDTENQIKKSTPDTSDIESARTEREGTPGPQSADETKPSDHPGPSPHKTTTMKPVVDGKRES